MVLTDVSMWITAVLVYDNGGNYGTTYLAQDFKKFLVCNNLNENTADSLFSEVKKYKIENPKKITISHLKAACVVKIKLFLWTDFIKIDNTNYVVHNPIKKFR